MINARFVAVLAVAPLVAMSLPRPLSAQENATPTPPPPGLLANEPQTVDQHFDAAQIMLRVSRPDLAKQYLRALLDLQPDDATLLRLRDEHGTATFFRLSRDEALLPEARELLNRVQQAAANRAQDPTYFDSLLAQLNGSPRERDAAITELKHYGADAIPELLARAANAPLNVQETLLFTLVNFGAVAVDPLLGAINAPNPDVRTLAIEALGWVGDESIVPRLWYPALAVDQPPEVQRAALQAIARIRHGDANLTDRLDPVGAAAEIARAAIQHFRGEYFWPADVNVPLYLWSWDNSQNRLVKVETNPTTASAFTAQQLAREAMLMAPERDEYRALFLATTLAYAQDLNGWSQPLPQGPGSAHNLALFTGPELVGQALSLAIEHQNAAAAIGALQALGAIATRNAMRPTATQPSPLIAALDFPNERVQFAAAEAVLQLDPIEPFPRSSRVIEILARALRTSGAPRGVVIDPNTSRAVQTASVLQSLGYEATIASTGKDGFCQAVTRADVELAVLHPNTIRWELSQTIANLRADSRSAGIPIVVAAGEPARTQMQLLLERVPRSTFVATSDDPANFHSQLKSVLAEVTAPPLTAEQQLARAKAAAAWLRYIAQRRLMDVFDLAPAEAALSEAATHPEYGVDAILALGGIARPSAQQRFADLIVAPAVEVHLREAAALELADHIQRHGRLLHDDTVRALMNAWNQDTDPALHSALTAVIGALGPTREAVFDVLQSFPSPQL